MLKKMITQFQVPPMSSQADLLEVASYMPSETTTHPRNLIENVGDEG